MNHSSLQLQLQTITTYNSPILSQKIWHSFRIDWNNKTCLAKTVIENLKLLRDIELIQLSSIIISSDDINLNLNPPCKCKTCKVYLNKIGNYCIIAVFFLQQTKRATWKYCKQFIAVSCQMLLLFSELFMKKTKGNCLLCCLTSYCFHGFHCVMHLICQTFSQIKQKNGTANEGNNRGVDSREGKKL